MSRSLTEEPNEPRTLPSSEWPGPALFLPRAAGTLVGGRLLRLSDADRSRLLEPVAVLDRGCPGRHNDFARITLLARSRLYRWDLAHVWHVAPADERDARRQGLVGGHRTLHSQ